MKFKVGDRVRLRSLQWYLENRDENGRIIYWAEYDKEFPNTPKFMTGFDSGTSDWCGKVVTIEKCYKDRKEGQYRTHIDGWHFSLVDEMLEPDPVVFEYAIEINGRLEPDIYYTEAEVKIALDVWKKARPMDDVKLRTLTLE